MSKELEALEKFLDDYLTLCEKLHTNRQEKMLLDSNSPYNVLKTYLEFINNSEPSDALECLECLYCEPEDYRGSDRAKDYKTIKNYILKMQESKQYLKWEDLDFKKQEQTMKVLLNGKEYRLSYFTDGICKVIDLLTNNRKYQIYRHVDCYSYDVQLFNDLHLERVE